MTLMLLEIELLLTTFLRTLADSFLFSVALDYIDTIQDCARFRTTLPCDNKKLLWYNERSALPVILPRPPHSIHKDS